LRQFVLGGEWSNSVAGTFSGRAYGGTQLFDQNFSAVAADRQSENLTRLQRVPAQAIGASLNWTRAFAGNQTIVAGVEAREVRGASDEVVYVAGRPTSLIGAGGRERTVGVYFEDLIRIGSRLFITPGLRFDRWRNFAALSATRPITTPSPTAVTFFPDRDEHSFSPQLAAVFRVNDRASLFASMSRAFRAPTLNELYRSFRVGNVLTLANENLQAERLTGGEAGARVGSSNDRFSFRGSFFWNEITRPVANLTLQTTPALITRQRQNLGRTRSRGIELTNDVRLNRNWNLSAGYLFADATVVSFPVNLSLEGLQLPQVPRHSFTFQTRYSNSRIATIAFQGRASSAQFDDDLNQFRLDSYFTLDGYVSRDLNRRWSVFVAVENILNQRYEVSKTPVTTLGPPILVRAGFRLDLGVR
jgi:outer membrane receptor protein involved in Fe transport